MRVFLILCALANIGCILFNQFTTGAFSPFNAFSCIVCLLCVAINKED